MEFDQNAQLDTSQIEDRRGSGGGRGGAGGGLGGMLGGSGGKIAAGGGGLGIIGLILALLLGGGNIFGGGGGATNVFPSEAAAPAATADDSASSVSATCRTGADANARQDCLIVGVVNSSQNYWAAEFGRSGIKYTPAKTQFFTAQTQTACGGATSAVGPFYCPADQKVYIDLEFYDELETKFGASGGKLAQAYVIAHEYGHHVQNLLGTSDQVQRSGNRSGATSPAVRLELQADCYAGVWVNHATTEPQPETGRPYITSITQQDIDDALSAANAVGDDWIQRRFQGRVNPDSFTHGTSAQRKKWFMVGYETGDPNRCDTFSGDI
jgi:hypothetical protein